MLQFIQMGVQMLHRKLVVGADHSAFKEAPDAFNGVSVNIAAHPSSARDSFSRAVCRCLCAIAFILCGFSPVYAGTSSWKDEHGQPAPDTQFRQSKDGFGGWLVVTPDADWREKWNTSPETVPHYNTANSVEKGKSLTILIFFVNPAADTNRNVDVTCDIQSIRPDGSMSIDQKEIPCLKGELQGDPGNIRLAAPVIKYVGESKDLPGKWTIKVTLRDNGRHVELPLKTSFELKP